jgi:hypothetical protein
MTPSLSPAPPGNAFIIDEGADNTGRCALIRRMCCSGYGRCRAQLLRQHLAAVTHRDHGGDAVYEGDEHPLSEPFPSWASLEVYESLVARIDQRRWFKNHSHKERFSDSTTV